MSAQAVSSLDRSVPLYANTIFQLETETRIKITSNVDGQPVIYRLDLPTVERTRSIALTLLQNNVKLCPPFLRMNTESNFGTKYQGKITFVFASSATRAMFKDLTPIPSILTENGFAELMSDASSNGTYAISYTGTRHTGMTGFNTAFTEISSEIVTRTETPCEAKSQVVAIFTIPESCFVIEHPSPRASSTTPTDKTLDYPPPKE